MLKDATVARLGLVLLLANACATLPTPLSAADDPAAAARALQQLGYQLGRMAEEERLREAEEEHLALERRRVEALEQQARDAEQRATEAERARQVQEAQTRQAAGQAERLRALTPPPKLAGRLVLHRDLVGGDALPPPQFAVQSRSFPAFAKQHGRAAWVNAQSQLVLGSIENGSTRVLKEGVHSSLVSFVGPDRIVLQDSGVELFDSEGRLLKSFGAGSSYRGPYEDTETGAAMWIVWTTATTSGTKSAKSLLGLDQDGNVRFKLEAEEFIGSWSADWRKVLARDGEVFTYFLDGEQQTQFKVELRKRSKQSYATQWWVGNADIVASIQWGDSPANEDRQFALWSVTTGEKLCQGSAPPAFKVEFANVLDSAPGHNRAYTFEGFVLDLTTCAVQRFPLAADGDQLRVYGSSVFILNPASGRVTEVDPQSMEVRKILVTGVSGATSFFLDPADRDILLVSSETETTLFRISTNERLAIIPGNGWSEPGSGMIGSYVSVPNTGLYAFRAWDRNTLLTSTTKKFVQALRKDTYETTDAWRERVAALSAPYTMTARVVSYDADAGRFSVAFRDIPYSLAVPPATARLLDGQKQLTLDGVLRPLDPDFVELTEARLRLPGGQSANLSIAPCPDALKDVLSLPRYRASRLATLWQQIADTSVVAVLDKARAADVSPSKVASDTRQLADQYALDAAQLRDGASAAVAKDLRRVDDQTLPLDYGCEGGERGTVCAYIEKTWRASAARATAAAMQCRGAGA